MAELPQVCEWFALCLNDATGTVTHPVLGAVPTCGRCVARMGLADRFTPYPAGRWFDVGRPR